MIFKVFLASMLLASAPGLDEGGWASVEPANRTEMLGMSDSVDPSIWVVFAKELDGEKILISFPEEPVYRYLDGKGDRLEVRASFDGMEYRMQVFDQIFDSPQDLIRYLRETLQEKGGHAREIADSRGVKVRLSYWKDGYWYFEDVLATAHRTYFFQTKSAAMEHELHQKFVNSFDLENLG